MQKDSATRKLYFPTVYRDHDITNTILPRSLTSAQPLKKKSRHNLAQNNMCAELIGRSLGSPRVPAITNPPCLYRREAAIRGSRGQINSDRRDRAPEALP